MAEKPAQTSSAEKTNPPETAAEVISSTRTEVSETWAGIDGRHREEKCAFLRAVLEDCGWNLSRAAKRMKKKPNELEQILRRQYPELNNERKTKGPGPGRPWPKRSDRPKKKTSSAEQASPAEQAIETTRNGMVETLKEMRERHLIDERALIRSALEAEDWHLRRAAKLLGVPLGSLQQALTRHSQLEAERKKKGWRPGRPSKKYGKRKQRTTQ